MSSTIVNQVIKLISVHTTSRVLMSEKILTYLFSAFLVIETTMLGTIILSSVQCIPQHGDLDMIIETTDHPPNGGNNYLAVVCASEIVVRAFIMIWLRLLMLLVGAFILFCNVYYVQRIDVELTKQHVIAHRRLAKRWLLYKILSFALALPVYLTTLILSYTIERFWTLLTPYPALCPRHMMFDNDRMVTYQCHFNQELPIFILWILAQLVGVCLCIMWCVSIVVALFLVYHKSSEVLEESSNSANSA